MQSSLDKVEASYGQLRVGCDRIYGLGLAKNQRVGALTTEVKELSSEQSVLGYVNSTLDQLLKTVSVESLETVEKLVMYGLRSSFPDQKLGFKIKVEQKRGTQHFEPILIHGGVEAPILDSFGGGPAAVVSFLLRILVCRRFQLAPVLILDESFSFVSSEYVPNVARLLCELADHLGFTIILVTHQPIFLEYASKAYVVEETSNGTVFKSLEIKNS